MKIVDFRLSTVCVTANLEWFFIMLEQSEYKDSLFKTENYNRFCDCLIIFFNGGKHYMRRLKVDEEFPI